MKQKSQGSLARGLLLLAVFVVGFAIVMQFLGGEKIGDDAKDAPGSYENKGPEGVLGWAQMLTKLGYDVKDRSTAFDKRPLPDQGTLVTVSAPEVGSREIGALERWLRGSTRRRLVVVDPLQPDLVSTFVKDIKLVETSAPPSQKTESPRSGAPTPETANVSELDVHPNRTFTRSPALALYKIPPKADAVTPKTPVELATLSSLRAERSNPGITVLASEASNSGWIKLAGGPAAAPQPGSSRSLRSLRMTNGEGPEVASTYNLVGTNPAGASLRMTNGADANVYALRYQAREKDQPGGTLIAVADPLAVQNDGLVKGMNAGFAQALVGPKDLPIYFDQYHHKPRIKPGLLGALPRGIQLILLETLLAGIVFAFGAAVHFGPPLPEPTTPRRKRIEYINAFARGLKESGGFNQAAAIVQSNIRDELRKRVHTGQPPSDRHLIERAHELGINTHDVATVLSYNAAAPSVTFVQFSEAATRVRAVLNPQES